MLAPNSPLKVCQHLAIFAPTSLLGDWAKWFMTLTANKKLGFKNTNLQL